MFSASRSMDVVVSNDRVTEMKRPHFALNPRSDAAHAKLIVLEKVPMVGE